MPSRFPLVLAGIGIYLGGLLLGKSLPRLKPPVAPDRPDSRSSIGIPGPGPNIERSTTALPFTERFLALTAGNPPDLEEQLSLLTGELDLAKILSALAEAHKLPRKHRKSAIDVLLVRWAELDGRGAVEYACTLSRSNREAGRKALEKVMDVWGRLDPDEAERFLQNIPNASLRDTARYTLAFSLIRSEPRKSLEILLQAPEGRSLELLPAVMTAVAEEDPPMALSAAMRMKADASVLSSIASGWGKRDPRAALAWARSIQDNKNKDQVIQEVAASWAESAPREAAEALLEMDLAAQAALSEEEAVERQIFGNTPMQRILSTWIRNDWKSAYDWIQGLPEQGGRAAYMERAQSMFVERDPRAFLELVKGDLSPRGNDRLKRSVQRWNRLDSAGVLAWARQQTDARVREAIWPVVAGEKAKDQPEEALNLAQELQGELRQKTLLSVVGNWTAVNPAAAASWVQRQYDGPQKTQQIEKVAYIWNRADENAASAWIGSLSPAQQEAARRSIKEKGNGLIKIGNAYFKEHEFY